MAWIVTLCPGSRTIIGPRPAATAALVVLVAGRGCVARDEVVGAAGRVTGAGDVDGGRVIVDVDGAGRGVRAVGDAEGADDPAEHEVIASSAATIASAALLRRPATTPR